MVSMRAEDSRVRASAMASRMQVKPSVSLPDSFCLKYTKRTLVLVPGTLKSQGTAGGPALRLSVHVYSSRSRGRLDETYCSLVGLTRSIESNGVSGECGDSEDDSVGRDRLRGPAPTAVMQRCESTATSETETISGNAMGNECMPGILIDAG